MSGPKIIQDTQHVPIKVWTEDVDEASIQQLRNTASMPFVFGHVAAMPDVHFGLGATIGSVVATKGALIPAAVGVDIGCGMLAANTGFKAGRLPDNLAGLRAAIERRIPVGFASHENGVPANVANADYITALFKQNVPEAFRGEEERSLIGKLRSQVGTLGGGNHFIEVCLDEDDFVWIMLHSGSRGIGNKIGQFYITQAKEEMRVHHRNLPDKDLAYLEEGTKSFDEYWAAMRWAQEYATVNRDCMFGQILEALEEFNMPVLACAEYVNCHHNYASVETHFGETVYVTRKGAVRAGAGEFGVIPGSMGARSYIVRGEGNPDSFMSCSHGAGRRMSRRRAREMWSVEDLKAQTLGVECRKDKDVLDEIPGAYKDIDQVMADQTDLVTPIHTLKQVLCVKG